MSTIIDVPNKLGEFMLKGWILTDNICPKCSKVPLMRSPSAITPTTFFCANCDDNASSLRLSNRPTTSLATPTPMQPASHEVDTKSLSSSTSSSHMTRTSTPPTDISSTLSSPTFAPPIDTEESLRRRQQSDAASAEIGRRMLKGWAMLADECPNNSCYGIPLVRPPKAGGERDPRKECVVCGSVYIYEKDAFGQDHLVPLQPPAVSLGPPAVPLSTSQPSLPLGRSLGAIEEEHQQGDARRATAISSTSSSNSTSAVLDASAQALELSLQTLSDRLKLVCSSPLADPALIGQTAESLNKVILALTSVKQLQWSESQARSE